MTGTNWDRGGRKTESRILGFGNEGIGYLTFPFQAKNFLLYSQYVRTMTKVVIELLGQLIMLSVLIFRLNYHLLNQESKEIFCHS